MDTKERYLGERDDTDWQALSLHVPLIPTIITITIASRWTVLNSFAAHTQPARGKTARRKKIPVQLMFRWRITCLGVSKCMRLSKKKKEKKKQGERPSHLHYKRISRDSADVFAWECQAISGWALAKWDSMFRSFSTVMPPRTRCPMCVCVCVCPSLPPACHTSPKHNSTFRTESEDKLR